MMQRRYVIHPGMITVLITAVVLSVSPIAFAEKPKAGKRQPTIIVAPQGQGDYESIDEALRSAQPGARIVVMPGDYKENLALKRRIEILVPAKATRKKATVLSNEGITSNIDGDDDSRVDPTLTEIVLKFPEAMKIDTFSLEKVDLEQYGEFPELMGAKATGYRDDRTFVLRVTLRPDTKYAFGLNTEKVQGFRTAKGLPLESTIYYFRTSAEQSSPEVEPPKTDFMDYLADFMKKPSRENYLALQKAIAEDENFSADTRVIDEALKLYDQRKYGDAQKRLKQTTPSLLLSPRANVLSAKIAEKQGDKDGAAFSFDFAEACLQGILSTGDGSEKKPFVVTLVADEYDLLAMHFKKKVEKQTLVQRQGKRFDVLQCTDGSLFWFNADLPPTKAAKKR